MQEQDKIDEKGAGGESVSNRFLAGTLVEPSAEGLRRFPELRGVTATVVRDEGMLLDLIVPRAGKWHSMFWKKKDS